MRRLVFNVFFFNSSVIFVCFLMSLKITIGKELKF